MNEHHRWKLDVLLTIGHGATGVALAAVALRRRRTMFTLPIVLVATTLLFEAAEAGVDALGPASSRSGDALRIGTVTASLSMAAAIGVLFRQIVTVPSIEADALTGLANRPVFMRELRRARRAMPGPTGDVPVAVLFVDLDHFKRVNDEFGHASGDRVLIEASARLRSIVPQPNVVARLGGDEFGVVLSRRADVESAELLGGRIVQHLARPYELDGDRTAVIGASVGVAFDDGSSSIAQLMRLADESMYARKWAKRARG